VPDEDLPALYAGAAAFVFPSLYEGFGLTPLEAMAAGTPVVSSAAASLPEVLGDAAVVVEGFDAGTWAERVQEVLSDSVMRDRLVFKGRTRAAGFTWERAARRTWDIYRHLLG
jgi:glycosyltransferase involved in cell wall biosynthesis